MDNGAQTELTASPTFRKIAVVALKELNVQPHLPARLLTTRGHFHGGIAPVMHYPAAWPVAANPPQRHAFVLFPRA